MKKISNVQVREKISAEGLGATIEEYVDSEHLSDPVLAVLWEDAVRVLTEIKEYLETADDDVMEELGSEMDSYDYDNEDDA
jgi:hypothetical protein